MKNKNKTKRALLSVSNKDGITDFAQELTERGWEIVSTGGTARLLQKAGIPVMQVEEVTGFPEILEGRVKTLHPFVHGGILAQKDKNENLKELDTHGITPISMVVVNLYPFIEVVNEKKVSLDKAMENIDIGGPAMLRAAAKNYRHTMVVINPQRYQEIIEALDQQGDLGENYRYQLATEAFQHTAEYDAFIASYFNQQTREKDTFPSHLVLPYRKAKELRYGENPQQKAALYHNIDYKEETPAKFQQWQGKELSFNNINDLDAAWELVKEFKETAVIAVKHTNPCGVGVARTVLEAYNKAYEADPVSIFGGIIAVNQEVDATTAEEMSKIFLEVIAAPSFSSEALNILSHQSDVRVLSTPLVNRKEKPWEFKKTSGGLLVQEMDSEPVNVRRGKVVTSTKPSEEQWKDMDLAQKVVKHVKSNAIVIASRGQTLGIGAGQMSRVGAAQIALSQAGGKAKGAVMASDAFFPFPDTAEQAARAGIKAIVQPGGSVKDQDAINVCNHNQMAMVFTGRRHFKH